MTKTTEEGPYRKVECGSNRPGSVKFYRIKGPDNEMDYAIHESEVDYHLNRLNAAWLAGRSSVTTVPLSPEVVDRVMEVVEPFLEEEAERVGTGHHTGLEYPAHHKLWKDMIDILRTRLLGIR
jgi:hypothetical protein